MQHDPFLPSLVGYVDNEIGEKALDLFEKLPEAPNDILYTIAYNACASLKNERSVERGNQLLGEMPRVYMNNPAVVGSMLKMLMKFGQVKDAEQLFQSMKRTLLTHGTMMQGL